MRRARALLFAQTSVLLVVGLVALAGVGAPLAGQDAVARFREALAAAPSDRSARCQLAFALVGTGAYAEARDTATPAIDALRAETGGAPLRLLGACLYNRGRAYEGLGDRAPAARDYAHSLAVRPNDAVRARLATLVPDVPADRPLTAIAAVEEGAYAFSPGALVATATTRDRTEWSFVALTQDEDGFERARAFAVARLCGVPRVAVLDEIYFDDAGLAVVSAQPRRFGDVDAVVVTISGTGSDNCGSADGMMDWQHASTVVVYALGCEIRTETFVTSHDDCERRLGFRLRFDRDGNAITSRPRRDTPASEIGTFRIGARAE